MKTKLLITCFLCFVAVIIEAQVSLDRLKLMYKEGAYADAIRYAEKYDYSRNAEVLFVLGNCYYEKAAQDETNANNAYYQALYSEAMAASMGIYMDNSFALDFYYKSMENVLQARLKAIDLYSKSSELGNQNAISKLRSIGGANGYSTPANSFAPSGGSTNSYNQPQTSQKCSYCNGTGKIATTVATYGQNGTKWCSYCGREMPLSHCCQCKLCPSCGGKGYR